MFMISDIKCTVYSNMPLLIRISTVNKKLSLVAFIFTLSGCSSFNFSMPDLSMPDLSMPDLSMPEFLKFGDDEKIEEPAPAPIVNQTVKISSECKVACQALVESSFSIQPLRTNSGKDKPVYDYVILRSINGIRGRKTFVDDSGSFNSPRDGSFEISTLPGVKELVLKPTYETNTANEVQSVSFTAQPGTKYLVGSMGWRKLSQAESIQINYWHPVVVDLSRNRVVYPMSRPQWSKYCTENREDAGSVACPDT
jgi:hypothetical protein